MALDAICLSAVLHELRGTVLGGKVDKIYQPSRDEIILAMRTGAGNEKLLLSASPNHPRPQLTALNRENPAQPPMFCMLLRKHLTGGRLLEITQPPQERIAIFTFETLNELGDRQERKLVLECMGNRANLILLDGEGRVTDCLRRVEGDVTSGKRAVLPGLFYRLPQPHPGLSPLIAREREARGAGEDWGEQLLTQVEAGAYTPTVLLRDGRPVDFTFLPITQYGPETTQKTYETFGALMDDFYAVREQAERARQKGQDLVKTATAARDRTARKLANQRRELENTENRERLRQLGDILTSNLHRMSKGMTALRAADYYDPDGAEVEIKLDPLLTPQQNAAKYYKEYNKAKTAQRVLTVQIEKGKRDLDYLESVLEAIPLAEGERDLQEIRQELIDTGFARRQKKSKAREKRVSSKPMEFRSSAGLRISVGKNNTQNDQLTTKQAGRGDIWLHTQKIHGSHVILWCEGQELDTTSLSEAAVLAAYFSQGREGRKVPVDYTPVKFVKKPAGAKPGMVVYTTYQTAYVDPDEELVKRLRVK
jgi:predicted ribosome quality control (RQC) complex YloA/Tae2 family protein